MKQIIAALLVVLATASVPAFANGKSERKAEAQRKLAKRAKISMKAARRIALKRAPGKVKSQELEVENGKLIYSFDIVQKGKDGIMEVAVDAKTGAIVEAKHESSADEAAEAKHDKEAGK